MAFQSPDLNENISTVAQINGNFTLIQTALNTLQNLIPRVQVQRLGGNIAWIDKQLRPDGVVGHQSFTPSFGTDWDSFAVFHNTPNGYSTVIIDEAIHETDVAFSQSFSSLITLDGTYEVVFGVRSRGTPICEMLLELEYTDKSQTLTIWTMDVTKSGAVWTVSNLRREAPVHMNRDSWEKTIDQQVPLTYQYEGTLPGVPGRLPTGILIPFDCEPMSAYMRLETPPAEYTDQGDVVIEIDRILDTDATNILGGSATFADSDGIGAIKTISGITPERPQLAAGTYVYPNLTSVETPLTDFPVQAAGLTITLLVRQIYHEIL
jgi:hypothetical protein